LNASPSGELVASHLRELEQLVQTLAPELRAALTEQWTLAARFEHASIASFNKFSLELLALGAPAELLAAANRAALEEVEHARASFAVASAYAGRGIGPGPLPITGLALEGAELCAVACAAVREGCVEETLAAAEAACAAERASVPAIRWVLEKIAREEGEHAGLAFRFVRWACAIGGAAVREAARQAFLDALAACSEPSLDEAGPEPGDLTLEQHGRLSASTRAALRQRARLELLGPAYRELFE
jgi:hypothetical protein